MRQLLTGLKWAVIVFLGLVVAVAAYGYYAVVSFDTETLPANHGQVQSRLYVGEADNQRLIVGLGGSEGGNPWASDYWQAQRDRFLEQGYAFLAVGYFGMEGTPENLDRISLDAIRDAAVEAAAHPRIADGCFTVMGGSRGGEGALLLGSYFPEFSTVVAIVPGSAVFPALTSAMTTAGFSLNDEPLPFVPVPWGATPELLTGNLRGAFQDMLANEQAVQHAAIPVEDINGPVLFVSATRDEMWPSTEMSDAMIQRLEDRGFSYPTAHIAIEGGHTDPLDHFDQIEAFLAEHHTGNDRIATTDCSPVEAVSATVAANR